MYRVVSTHSDKRHPSGTPGHTPGAISLLVGFLQHTGLREDWLKVLLDFPRGHGRMNVHFVEGGGNLGIEDAVK